MEASSLASITGKIRAQGSNFSHETRRARLLATSQTKIIFSSYLLLRLKISTLASVPFNIL